MHRNSSYFSPALLLMSATLGGCAVGPDFRPPAPPPVGAYTRAADAPGLGAGAGAVAQRLAAGAAIPAGWWRGVH